MGNGRDLHQKQLEATKNREMRATRRLELMKMCDEIVEAHEQAKELEWEAEMHGKEQELKKNEKMLERKGREKQMSERLKQQEKEYLELQETEINGSRRTKSPGNLNPRVHESTKAVNKGCVEVTRALFTQGGSKGISQQRTEVADWVSTHSQFEQEELSDLERCARKIKDNKSRSRPEQLTNKGVQVKGR